MRIVMEVMNLLRVFGPVSCTLCSLFVESILEKLNFCNKDKSKNIL